MPVAGAIAEHRGGKVLIGCLTDEWLEGDGTKGTETGANLWINELLVRSGCCCGKEHPVRTAGLGHRKVRQHPGEVLEDEHRVIGAERAVAADVAGALLGRAERAQPNERLQHIDGVEDADRTVGVAELLRLHLPRILRQPGEGEVSGIVGRAGRG